MVLRGRLCGDHPGIESSGHTVAGQKRLAVIFVEAGNILDWFNQAIGKIWQWSAI